MPPQKGLWLNDEQRLFPGPHYACQQDQEDAVRLATDRPFHLSTQDDQLMSQQRIFRQQFGFASGQIIERSKRK